MQKTTDQKGKSTIRATEQEVADSAKRSAEDSTKFKAIVLEYGAPYLEQLTVKTGQVGRDKSTAKAIGNFPVRKGRSVAEVVALHGEQFVVDSANATYSRAVGAGVRGRHNRADNPIQDEESIKLDMGAHQDDGVGMYDNLDYGTRAGYSRDSVEATLKREIDKLSKALTKATPLEAPAIFADLQAKSQELFQHKQGKATAQLDTVPTVAEDKVEAEEKPKPKPSKPKASKPKAKK